MPTPIRTEYAELDGTPLATAAWDTLSLLDLYEAPEVRGDDPVVPYRRGSLPYRRITGAKPVTLPIIIYGDNDSDGNPHTDAREGLLANIDEFKNLIADQPRLTEDGTRLLRHYTPGAAGNRVGEVQVIGNLGLTEVAPTTVQGALELLVHEGVLRGETETDVTSGTASDGGFLDFVVPNPGTTYQDKLTYTLTSAGTTTSVKLTNLTADPGGDVWLEFGGDVGPTVVIDTDAWTAIRSSISVLGLITYSGFESWLPLVPGNNTIRIEPVGAGAELQAQHFPRYL